MYAVAAEACLETVAVRVRRKLMLLLPLWTLRAMRSAVLFCNVDVSDNKAALG